MPRTRHGRRTHRSPTLRRTARRQMRQRQTQARREDRLWRVGVESLDRSWDAERELLMSRQHGTTIGARERAARYRENGNHSPSYECEGRVTRAQHSTKRRGCRKSGTSRPGERGSRSIAGPALRPSGIRLCSSMDRRARHASTGPARTSHAAAATPSIRGADATGDVGRATRHLFHDCGSGRDDRRPRASDAANRYRSPSSGRLTFGTCRVSGPDLRTKGGRRRWWW